MSGRLPVAGVEAEDVTPSARRLVSSLRDIGYDFTTALADIVDNSVAAGSSRVDVDVVFDGSRSFVAVSDDGDGMSAAGLTEALRFGTRREYERNALGRYGLGLKTASLSQARRLTVLTRQAPSLRRIAGRSLDLDHVISTDRWEIIPVPADSIGLDLRSRLHGGPGTVVVWELLDRVLPLRRPDGGWARRRLEGLAQKAADYLGMVFHRFIDGGVARPDPLVITVNGEKVRPWNPFAPGEEHRTELVPERFQLDGEQQDGWARLRRFVLPSRESFSSSDEFERLAGPRKWNRQQGFYIYRADRMIQAGGWCGLRAPDEHTKYARASLDFDTELDSLFQINVAKMRVILPAELRPMVEGQVHELCATADAAYRHDAGMRSPDRNTPATSRQGQATDASTIGTSLVSAALDADEGEAISRVMDAVRSRFPDVATSLGW